MFSQQTLFRSSIRATLSTKAFRTFGPRSDRTVNTLICASKKLDQSQISNVLHKSILARFMSNSIFNSPFPQSGGPNESETEGSNLSMISVSRMSNSPFNSPFARLAGPKELETEGTNSSMSYVSRILNENRRDNYYHGGQESQHAVEYNADVVHIKLIRNNTFVTLTDSKGNKKAGASSGVLSEMKGGPKVSKYASEATAEHIGRVTRSMGLKSVVMKVNGFTMFKKKKQAILSFREGYTHSRGDSNPVVYIEDTTRKPHNGCRLKKKRRK